MHLLPGRFYIGQTVQLAGSFKTPAGAVLPVTGVTLRMLLPDGSRTTDPLVPDVAGLIQFELEATQVGRWYVRVDCTSPTRGVEEGYFDVIASAVLLEV